MTQSLVRGLRRVPLEELLVNSGFPKDELFWLDQVLYDIPTTVLHAVMNAVSAGARAVTLHRACCMLKQYHQVIDYCKKRNITIVQCDDEYVRSIFWEPDAEHVSALLNMMEILRSGACGNRDVWVKQLDAIVTRFRIQ